MALTSSSKGRWYMVVPQSTMALSRLLKEQKWIKRRILTFLVQFSDNTQIHLCHLKARSALDYSHHSWVFKHLPPAQSCSLSPTSAALPRGSPRKILRLLSGRRRGSAGRPRGSAGRPRFGLWGRGCCRWRRRRRRRSLSKLKAAAGLFCGLVCIQI